MPIYHCYILEYTTANGNKGHKIVDDDDIEEARKVAQATILNGAAEVEIFAAASTERWTEKLTRTAVKRES